VGTTASPIVFTSINDNSVGGTTGTGSPAAEDWTGITVATTGSLDIEGATLGFAKTAINESGGSTSNVVINGNLFESNDTAVSLSTSVTTNARITSNSFLGNAVAIDASSNWTTATAGAFTCGYVPTMMATGNTFGPSHLAGPLVSAADYAAITSGSAASSFNLPIQTYPSDWTSSLAVGTTDTTAWSVQPCINVVAPSKSYVAIAVPLNFSGSPIIPVG
jgi:hypothetical protein